MDALLSLVAKLLDAVVDAVGADKARDLLSAKAVLLANEAADAIERQMWEADHVAGQTPDIG